MKTKHKLLYLCMLFVLPLMESCNPESDLDLPKVKKQIVVDGWIEQNSYPYVLLTYNSAFFSNLDSASFRSLVASRAKVTVSDGTISEVLTLSKDTNYFPPYIYKGTGDIIGKAGGTYTLLIEDEIDTLSATTTIPWPVFLDSIWFEPNSLNDTLGQIKGSFSDNANEKNYYRTLTKEIKNKLFVPTLISIFDDNYFNGQKFTFSLRKGPETFLKPQFDIYFKKGENIWVKIETIDKASFEFWSEYQKEVLNSGNPFAGNHNTIPSNVKGGLGIWYGYGVSIYYVRSKSIVR